MNKKKLNKKEFENILSDVIRNKELKEINKKNHQKY